MNIEHDPEDDSADNVDFDDLDLDDSGVEDEDTGIPCLTCGELEDEGQCVNPFCKENPDNELDDDAESD